MSSWGNISKNASPKIPFGSNENEILPDESGGPAVNFAVVKNVNLFTGTKQGQITFSFGESDPLSKATPLLPHLNCYPVEGEMVIIIDASEIRNGGLANKGPNYVNGTNAFFYLSPLNLWSNPSLNGIDPPPSTFPTSKTTSTPQPQSCPGDIILKGRFSNNIRLGNTSNVVGNNWSQDGSDGDPITIISNGQKLPIEDIKNDLSSIYLTSYQKIANFSLANENFNSYKTPPEKPTEYKQPQIILNSDRVILNAKTDEVLISGEKSIGLSSNKSVNIESKETIIDGNVLLGSKDAKESALLGDTTQELLTKLTTEVRNLSLALQTVPFAVGPVASMSTPILENILSDMSKIKSNTVKLK
jgi:hypothetical protein